GVVRADYGGRARRLAGSVQGSRPDDDDVEQKALMARASGHPALVCPGSSRYLMPDIACLDEAYQLGSYLLRRVLRTDRLPHLLSQFPKLLYRQIANHMLELL